MRALRNYTTATLPIRTCCGVFTATYSARGLTALHFPAANKQVQSHVSASGVKGGLSQSKLRAWHRITAKALRTALKGLEPRQLPPLDLSTGTPFQRRVWRALRKIPVGTVCTYAKLAKAIGKPTAARAVGNACGANPIPIFIPCHRVVAARVGLGGFSAGLYWKRVLLAREGALVLF